MCNYLIMKSIYVGDSILFQLVECTYLREVHDLVHREAEASDGIHLVPSGMTDLLAVKKKQFAMHCNAIKDEIKLVIILA